jgi:DNA-binding PadR family transcriptional regulator
MFTTVFLMSATRRGPREAMVHKLVQTLGDAAYGASVRRSINETCRKQYSIGAIYTTLTRLEEKGLLTSRMTEPLPERGGRSRRNYEITGLGASALQQTEEMVLDFWGPKTVGSAS